jgi:hypothetical protein
MPSPKTAARTIQRVYRKRTMNNAIKIEPLIRAHNNALRRRQQTGRAAAPYMLACMGNFCLNFPRQTLTPNQTQLIANFHNANKAYETAYNTLKKALRQHRYVNGNNSNSNNNLYGTGPNRPPNFMRPTSNAVWNLARIRRVIGHVTTVQSLVRGEQQRQRSSTQNPYTPLGHGYQLSRYFSNRGHHVTGRQLHNAATRIQRIFRGHSTRRRIR